MKNMLMKRMKLAGAVLLTALLTVACGPKTDEKKIDIAYVNWSEGIAMTNLAKVIFEEQGYRVNLLNADLAPVFASLSQKKADVFLDAWLPVTMADYITQYGDKLETLGTVYDNARIGLVVPEYVTINSIEELNQVRARFKGEIVGIDARSWNYEGHRQSDTRLWAGLQTAHVERSRDDSLAQEGDRQKGVGRRDGLDTALDVRSL